MPAIPAPSRMLLKLQSSASFAHRLIPSAAGIEAVFAHRAVQGAATIAALFALCWGLAQGTWRVVQPGSPAVSRAGGADFTDLRALADAHPFGRAAAAPPRDPAADARLARSNLNITLTGVVVRASGGCALVIVQGQPESAYCIGEDVVPGARLESVLRDRIVIARGGAHERRGGNAGRRRRRHDADRAAARLRPAAGRSAPAAAAARPAGIPEPGADRAETRRRRVSRARGAKRQPLREAGPASRRRDPQRQRPADHQHGRRDAALPAVRQRRARARGRAAPGPLRDALLRYALMGRVTPNSFALMRQLRIPANVPRIFAGLLALGAQFAAAQPADTPVAPSPPPAATLPAAPAAPSPPSAVSPAGIRAAPRSGEVLLNFQSADLQAVVKAMSQMTGRNVLVDPRVRGQVTIVSARPMPVAAAFQVFLSALKAQGFTAVDGPEGAVRIIPVAEAKAAAPVNERDAPPRGGEQIVTQVVIGQHVAVSQLQNVLRPLMSPTSQLSVYDPANALIITDYADNVRRLLRIIERIDVPAGTEVIVVPLQNASAIDLAELVVRLSGSGVATPGVPGAPQTQIAAGGDRFSVVPDTRTNSLLLRSDNPGRIAQLRSLIEKLDVPARAIGSTRVIYLKHAEAPKLVEVLRGMLSAGAAGAPGAAPGVARPAGGAPQSLIQADEATNSIIINASDTVYNNLRTVIEQLDVRRAQVYVEALVAEMNADRTDELGVQWAAARGAGSRTVGAAANFPAANPSIAAAIAAPTAAAAT